MVYEKVLEVSRVSRLFKKFSGSKEPLEQTITRPLQNLMQGGKSAGGMSDFSIANDKRCACTYDLS